MKHSFAVRFFALMAAVVGLASCSPAQFSTADDKNGSLGVDGEAPVAICDPFDNSNIISATSGLQGTIHYLQSQDTTYDSSAAMIANGKKVNAELFLNRLFVPTRLFDTGFADESGVGIRNSEGELLIEWFALNLKSKIKLGPGDAPGDYQFAVISDDGSTFQLLNDRGVFENIVRNEGLHHTRMECAAKTVAFTNETKIPMNLTYFQGPRFHIALNLLWRKIPSGAGLAERECGQEGDDHFFNVGTADAPATPNETFNGLLSRGWKPLNASNFELQSGSNRCAAP